MNGIRNPQPLINGVEPGWSHIVFNIAGVAETSVRAINFKTSQEKEDIAGVGQDAVARGYGRKKHEGSIKLLRSAVENIRLSVETKDLTDIAPFEIVVAWIPIGQTLVITKR